MKLHLSMYFFQDVVTMNAHACATNTTSVYTGADE